MIGISSFNDIPWPTEDWSRSTPEEQGMDSVRLVEMLNAMRDRVRDIESLLRIRNGRLLLEAYRYPYHPDTLHSLMSCTKSVTSAMIGIAIGQGTIGGGPASAWRSSFQNAWVKFVLDKPLRDAPGTRFVYNTGSSHLLSAIL